MTAAIAPQRAGTRQPSSVELSYLRMFSPDTYGLSIPGSIARPMEAAGWIEWVPPKFGTTLYAITDAGREATQS